MSKWILYLIIGATLFGGGYFVAINTFEPPAPVIFTETDTSYIPSEPIVLWKTAYIDRIVFDTTIVNKTDTIVLNNDTIQVAKDTVNFKEGLLETWYYYLPLNQFKYNWKPAPKEVVKETIVITQAAPIAWYNRKELWGVTGLIVGAVVRGK